jgi:hypothetical protein
MWRNLPALAVLLALLALGGTARPALAQTAPPVSGCVTLPSVWQEPPRDWVPDWSASGWDCAAAGHSSCPFRLQYDFYDWQITNTNTGSIELRLIDSETLIMNEVVLLAGESYHVIEHTKDVGITISPDTLIELCEPVPTPTMTPLPTSTAIPSVTLTLDDALTVAPQLAQEHVARWNIGSGSAGVFWSLGILTAILSMPLLITRMVRRVGL